MQCSVVIISVHKNRTMCFIKYQNVLLTVNEVLCKKNILFGALICIKNENIRECNFLLTPFPRIFVGTVL